MQTLTPSQFAKKMAKVGKAVRDQDKNAITARATVAKQYIVKSAEASSKMGRRYGRRYVKQDLLSKDTAQLRLKGGFAFLNELGSYKASGSGWDETARAGFSVLGPTGIDGGKGNSSGFFASVHHPPIAAHPFWTAGVEAGRAPATKAWKDSIQNSIVKAVR